MAGYIKGITIQIDGETKDLDAALKKINTNTRKLQSELKRVDSLLKLNPGKVQVNHNLTRRYVTEIIISDERFRVRFKAGIDIDIDRK